MSLMIIACGSEGSDGDVSRDAGVEMDAGRLEDSGVPRQCSGRNVARVAGALHDETGNGLEDARAQVCIRVHETEALVCLLPEAADEQGQFDVSVPDDGTQCVDRIAMRALLPGESLATSYCEVDLSGGNERVEIEEPITLFETTPATDLPPEGIASQSRTVVFEDGLEVDVVPERFFSDYAALSARSVSPEAEGLCFLPRDHEIEKLFAFYPESNIQGTFSMRVRLAESGARTSSVALYVLGGLECAREDGSEIEEGDFVRVETTTVTAQGVAHFDLPCFNWFGVGRVIE